MKTIGETHPLISVVIPFFDPPEELFREAIASVLDQTYRPIELILVNDGSSDRLIASLKEKYAHSDISIHWIQHSSGANEGCSASRDLGISVAAGDYVAFLDADDVWVPDKLAEQVAVIADQDDVALVFGQTLYWHSWRGPDESPSDDFIPWGPVSEPTIFDPPDYLVTMIRQTAVVPSISNYLIQRAALERCGGFETEFRGLYEDQALLAKLCLRERICAVPRCWDKYRQHASSMMATTSRRDEALARHRFLLWFARYCRSEQICSAAIWEAIAKGLWLNHPGSSFVQIARYRTVRRARNWWLRLEEFVLPRRVSRLLWNAPHVERRWFKDNAGRNMGHKNSP